MPLISDSVPSLNNGVSQQPDSLRERTQCSLQENAYSNLATGLTKRPCTRNIKTFSSTWANPFIHNIKRDNQNIYTLVLSDVTPKVIDTITGAEPTVHYTENKIYPFTTITSDGAIPSIITVTVEDTTQGTGLADNDEVVINNVGSTKDLNGKFIVSNVTTTGFTYSVSRVVTTAELTGGTYTKIKAAPTTGNDYLIESNAANSFAATTIADYTYVVNKNKTVEKSATPTTARPKEALAYIRTGSYGTDYSLTIAGVTSSVATATSSIPSKSVNEHATSTALIASRLLGGLAGYTKINNGTITTGVNPTDTVNKYTNSNSSSRVAPTGIGAPTTDGVYYQTGTYSKGGTWVTTQPSTNIILTDTTTRRVILTTTGTSGGTTTHTVSVTDTTSAASVTENEVVSATLGPYTLTREKGGSVIYIKTTGSTLTIELNDSRGGIYTKLFQEQTPVFADLPPKGVSGSSEGFLIKVIGNNEKVQDDYYVEMQKGVDGSSWIYKETAKDGIVNDWDTTTLPHRVIRNSDDSFSIQETPWEGRGSGDDETNPFVSILGNTINDIFFHQNRLGLLSNENAIFSEAGRFFSLFQNSVLNLVDTDAIDVAVSSNVVNILKYAVPFSESLIIFSENSQFILKTQNFLSPLTVSIDITTQYEASLIAKPVGAGRFVFFPTNEGAHSGILEFFVEANTVKTNDAVKITEHIPKYIEGTVNLMKASSNAQLLCLKTDSVGFENIVYIYSYTWQGGTKLQSSWSKWVFAAADKVLYFDFVDRDLVFVIERGNTVSLERLTLGKDDAIGDWGYPVHLDRRVRITSLNDVTNFITNHYSDNAQIFVKKGVEKTAAQLTAENTTNPISTASPVYAGVPFTFKYQFSQFYYRNFQGTVLQEGRLQIRYMQINFTDSGLFYVVVTPTGGIARDTQRNIMNADTLGITTTVSDFNVIRSGVFKVPVHSDSGDASITLESNSFLPCIFQSATWEGTFFSRSRRVSGNPFRLQQKG